MFRSKERHSQGQYCAFLCLPVTHPPSATQATQRHIELNLAATHTNTPSCAAHVHPHSDNLSPGIGQAG
ncbi:hypothetical protein E2C01_076155 [Portunus trituberculatus]|uniref:Uncharacterized protein n=1 Tax=Portunus trituberculatus TaxID=210409 RepID=A0A5B7IGS5_PORTR|nr:hypothetical protein [Portunus trituberculatus]